jgi:hypothetical protein
VSQMSGWQDPVVGGTVLRVPAIQSPNFVAGVSGWAIFQDGTADFNDANITGTITGGAIVGATIDGGTIDGTTIEGSSVTADIVNIESADAGLFVYALL